MKREEVILVGAGGHALSLAEFGSDRILGYLANEENPGMPGEWLGTDDVASRFAAEGKRFHVAYVYSGLPLMERRRLIIENYRNAGGEFITMIAPTAIITPNSKIGVGCAVMQGAIINRATLHSHVIVNSGAIVEHDCVVGSNSFIGPGAVVGGFTTIGENCFIGLGARVGNGLVIGNNVTVAMGAIVSRNLMEPGIYHGFPLKRYRI